MHVGHSPAVHPLQHGESRANIDVGLLSPLATAVFSLSTPGASPRMIRLISVVLSIFLPLFRRSAS